MAGHTPFIDLHVHFPMHTPFPPLPFDDPKDQWKKFLSNTANTLFNYEFGEPRSSLDRWFRDDPDYAVTGFGSVLYDPEDEFLVKTGTAPIPRAIDHILKQLENVETEISDDGRVRIARNPTQVEQYLDSGQKFIFHTLEGGFLLGGDYRHVETLANLGVACLTPAHLLYRSVATCEVGFPPLAHALFKHELESQPNLGLTDLGKQIVEECFRKAVIVDITHARSDAQCDIFSIADGYPDSPLISSHNSVRAICDASLNLSNEAILRIKKSNGVVGVIFYTHWLRRQRRLDFRSGFRLITDVIDHVIDITGSDDHVAIGSDLDGFIDPIQRCSNYQKMSTLARHIIQKYPQATAEKILYRNALRVLQCGWKGV